MQKLDEELNAWLQRPLGEITYLLLDARYEKVRVAGSVVSCACWWPWALRPRVSGRSWAPACRCRKRKCTGGSS